MKSWFEENTDRVLEVLKQDEVEYIAKEIAKINQEIIEYHFSGHRSLLNIKMAHQNYLKESENKISVMISQTDDMKLCVNILAKFYANYVKTFGYTLYQEIENDLLTIIDHLVNIRVIHKSIKVSYQECVEKEYIIGDIDKFSQYFSTSSLSSEDQFRVIMGLIGRNIDSGILSDNHFSYIPYSTSEMKGLNFDEAVNIVYDEDNKELLHQENKELSRENLDKKSILLESKNIEREKGDSYMKSIIPYYQIIKSYYFDKFDEVGKLQNFTEVDKQKIIDSLSSLGVTDAFLNIARKFLSKSIETKVKESFHWNSVSMVQNKKRYNDQEYKQIKKKISEFFDLRTGKTSRNLTEEEILYCANLMLEIGEDEKLIHVLFDRGFEKIDDPLFRYVEEYQKLRYYEEKLSIGEEIELMDQIVQEMLLASQSEYKDWEQLLWDVLQKVEHLLPNNYSYEMKKVKEYKAIRMATNDFFNKPL